MIKVLDPGFFSSIQDIGRFGYQKFGVPHSGALDLYSAILANQIVGNPRHASVIEATMIGPKLEFDNNTTICLTGADMSAMINDEPVKINTAISIKANDKLSLGKSLYGFRGYIAVKNGFQTECVMKSRSMYPNITKNSTLKKNDVLKISDNLEIETQPNAMIKVNHQHFKEKCIEVSKGPEYSELRDLDKNKLFDKEFTISKNNNRMAYQLEEPLSNDLTPIITSLVMPGTIQLTPSGNLIILMRDCQTTGGYPRILQLKESSMNVLAQKSTDNKIKLVLTN